MRKQEWDFEDKPARGALAVGQAVELEVIGESELGYKAAIDDRYLGLIYRSEIPQPLQPGQFLKGWVKAVRPDGKIDLSITRLDAEAREELEEQILAYLRKRGGKAPLSDRTTPEEVHRLFRTSKKNFKRAIGRLYKSRLILIHDDALELLAQE
jgi:predicted RNA-binding protein (virulence factor B family)